MSVELSTVIFGPIDHVGWARASATVTRSSSARVRPRNGPPLAVRRIRRTASSGPGLQRLVDGGVLRVDRHDLAAALGPGGRAPPARRR